MAYAMSGEQKHVEYCYECKNPFVLNDDHAKTYTDTGLCEKCYHNAMIELVHPELDKMRELRKLLNDVSRDIDESIEIINKYISNTRR